MVCESKWGGLEETLNFYTHTHTHTHTHVRVERFFTDSFDRVEIEQNMWKSSEAWQIEQSVWKWSKKSANFITVTSLSSPLSLSLSLSLYLAMSFSISTGLALYLSLSLCAPFQVAIASVIATGKISMEISGSYFRQTCAPHQAVRSQLCDVESLQIGFLTINLTCTFKQCA